MGQVPDDRHLRDRRLPRHAAVQEDHMIEGALLLNRRHVLGLAVAAPLVTLGRTQDPREVMVAFRRAYQNLDGRALEALLSPDITFADPTFHTGANGLEEMRAVIAEGVREIASVAITVEHELVCAPWVVVRQELSIVRRARADRRIDVRGVSLFRVQEGLIVEWHDYYDAAGYHRQANAAEVAQ
jgi:limonene-1,2-epoxide hydrolase